MKRLTGLMGIWALALSSVVALAQLTSTGAGKKAAGAASYSGPGNIVAGATAWYGLRAYSAADRGNPLLNVCNVADVACADLSSDATTGAIVISAIGGSSCSVVTCTIKTMYDRSGNGYNATQATIGNRPTLVVSCINSLPCAAFVNQKLIGSGAGITAGSSTSSITAVAWRTAGTTTAQRYLSTGGIACNGNQVFIGFTTSVNTATLYAGTSLNATASDNAAHAINAKANTSGILNIDGTSATGSSGSGSSACGAAAISIGADFPSVSSSAFQGNLTELGLYYTYGFTTSDITSLCHNQYTYWGTSVSC